MGQPQARKGGQKQNKKLRRCVTAKKGPYGRDHDQINADLKKKETDIKAEFNKIDEHKPGLGQFYCVACATYYASEKDLKSHEKSKAHKKRLKMMKAEPHTKEQAEELGKF